MPLDHDVEILLKMIQEANRPSFETVGAIAARELFMAGRKALSPDPMPIAETRDLAISGPGGAIPARLYRSVTRSEEHTSELPSRANLGCRLPLDKKKPS